MRNLALAVATATTVFGGATLMSGGAEAAMLGAPDGVRAAADGIAITEHVQAYWYGGRQYCWYDDGWHGPGWYWCGYPWRSGYGWGGPWGWRGWGWHGHWHHGWGHGGWHGHWHHSDIRLKEDIVPLARLDNGIELYRFRYKGDHTAYVGVMAQEVQEIEPSAVSRDRDGYLMVNYDRLGVKFMSWDKWLAQTGAADQSAR